MIVVDSSIVLGNGVNGNQSGDGNYDVNKFFGKPFLFYIVYHEKEEKIKPFVFYGDKAVNSIVSEESRNYNSRKVKQNGFIQIGLNPE
jgi:hypothetical protein